MSKGQNKNHIRSGKPINGKAHVIGETAQPLINATIGEILKRAAEKFPHNDAAVFAEDNLRISYQKLKQESDQFAVGLLKLGLKKGDRIGIWAPNRYEWLITQFATARIGLIMVNINPAYRPNELLYALNKVECKALITAEKFKSSNYIDMLQKAIPELQSAKIGNIQTEHVPSLKIIIRMGHQKSSAMFNFNEIPNAKNNQNINLDDIEKILSHHDPINIQFTSGTTGTPKGATLSHFNIVNNAHFVTRGMRFSEKDRLCINVPLYHCFGMVMGTLGCATKGAAMIFPSQAFDPYESLKAIEKEKCTALYGVPTMFINMLNHPQFERFDLSSLRTGIISGAPCPVAVMQNIIKKMHMKQITIAYGMTETSPVSFQGNINDTLEKRVSTVGQILPHLNVKIVDENGKTMPVGEKGELWTSGYSVMCGYWNDNEKTKEAIFEGKWMKSGDLAKIDQDGYCAIVGRVKDMLIRGGENIFPREIEDFLFQHPAIHQIQVFGVPDDIFGEEVCAWIVLKQEKNATEEEIRQFCKGQIAHYKIPKYIRFKDELPMTVTGKPQKFIMREHMIRELQKMNS